jgi:hypothetical protein
VSRLVKPQTPSSRQRNASRLSPPLLRHRLAFDSRLLQSRDLQIEVIGHEIQLVQVVLIGGVHGQLGRRQLEDQPAPMDVDVFELQDVSDESAIASAFPE